MQGLLSVVSWGGVKHATLPVKQTYISSICCLLSPGGGGNRQKQKQNCGTTGLALVQLMLQTDLKRESYVMESMKSPFMCVCSWGINNIGGSKGAQLAHVPQGSQFFCFDIQICRNVCTLRVGRPPIHPHMRLVLLTRNSDPPLDRPGWSWYTVVDKGGRKDNCCFRSGWDGMEL